MSFDYQPLLDTVKKLLSKFGVEMTLNSPGTGGTFDPVTELETGGTAPSSQTFIGVRLSPTKEYVDAAGQQSIQAQDMLIYMEGGITPTMSDSVVDERGKNWEIVNIEELRPGDVTLMFTLQVR